MPVLPIRFIDAFDPPLPPFSPTTFNPTWVVGGTPGPTFGGGVATFSLTAGTNGVLGSAGSPALSLAPFARNFYLQFKVSGLVVVTGANVAAFGVSITADDGFNLTGQIPLVEFGGSAAGVLNTYFGLAPMTNEIGDRHTIAGTPASTFHVRIVRSDTIIQVAKSTDGGTTWQLFDAAIPSRTVVHRYFNQDDVVDETSRSNERITFCIRTAASSDTAGLTAVLDDVVFGAWEQYSTPLTVGNLYARSWPDGGRVDLSWTNTVVGIDEARSLTIVRSQMAPPELIPDDLVDEPVPIMDVDLTVPSPVWLPTNRTEWQARYPGVATPVVYWALTVDPGVSDVGDDVFSMFGGIAFSPFNSPTNMKLSDVVGLNTGSMRRLVAHELIDTGSPSLVCDSLTLLDPSSLQHCAIWILFRVARQPSAQRGIASNISAGPTNGWRLVINSSGQLLWQVVGSSVTVSVTLPANYGDGAWHSALGIIDWQDGRVQAWGDLDGLIIGGALPSISAASGTTMSLGTNPANASCHMQVAAVACWQGVDSRTIREAQARLLYTNGQIPFALPDGVTATYFRGGNVAAGEWGWAENESTGAHVAKYSGGTAYTAAHLLYRVHRRYEHPTRMAATFDSSVTNLLTESEDTTGVTFTSASSTNQAGPSPDGLHTAIMLTQTAVDGRAFFSVTGLSTGTNYWVSVYIRSEATTGHKLTLWIRDSADSTANVNQKNFVYAQPYWKRVNFLVSTGAGTSLGIRLYGGVDGVDTNKVVSFWGRSVFIGSTVYPPDYIPRVPGSSGTRGITALTITGAQNGLMYQASRGEVRAQFSRLANSVGALGSVVVGQRTTLVDNDRRSVSVDNTDRVSFIVFDNVTPSQFSVVSGVTAPGTEPLEVRGDWRDTAPLSDSSPNHVKLFVNATDTAVTKTSNFTSGSGVDRVFIGSRDLSGGQPLIGDIAFVRFYASNPSCDGSQVPTAVGLDPLGKVIYSGVPIGEAGGAGTYTDSGLTEGKFYYYTLFPSRMPPSIGTFTQPMTQWTRGLLTPSDTDIGPIAASTNRVGGLSVIDRVAIDGKRFYEEFPAIYRSADEDDRKAQGRTTGLLDDLSTFLQRGVDQAHSYIVGMVSVLDPETGPIGLIGTPQNQTCIADAFLRQFSVNPDAVGLLGTARRRLWGGVIEVLKQKGTVAAIEKYVKLITGWSAIVLTQPSLDFAARYLRTWDGETSLQPIVFPSTSVVFAAGSFTIAGLGLSPNRFQNGLYVDWFGNVKQIASNTDTQVVFADTVFTPVAERTFTAAVSGGNTAQVTVDLNDDQYNFGFIHQTGLGAAVAITDTLSATKAITTAGGLTVGAAEAIAVAAAFTGNFAARVPTFTAWLWNGEHSALYDPGALLALRGTPSDPFFTLWPGLAPTGSGYSYPATDDDVIVWAPIGAARAANRQVTWLSADGTAAIIEGGALDARPGDYINPNRNQAQWFRIIGVHLLGTYTYVSVTLIDGILSMADVAALYDLATVAARQTVEHDRAVRSMVPAILPVNGRVFVYYTE